MSPAFLFTVSTPFCTVHPAGFVVSLAVTHCERSRPSKSTIASEGGAAFVAPGVTIFGTGVQTSVSSGLPFACCCCASAGRAPIMASAMRESVVVFMEFSEVGVWPPDQCWR